MWLGVIFCANAKIETKRCNQSKEKNYWPPYYTRDDRWMCQLWSVLPVIPFNTLCSVFNSNWQHWHVGPTLPLIPFVTYLTYSLKGWVLVEQCCPGRQNLYSRDPAWRYCVLVPIMEVLSNIQTISINDPEKLWSKTCREGNTEISNKITMHMSQCTFLAFLCVPG